MENLVGLAVMLAVPAYPVAQVLALIRWRGLAFWLALVPALVMGLAVAAFIAGMAQDSNLAPLLMVLAAPPCLIWLWVVSRFQG
jgi:hypothetical protein